MKSTLEVYQNQTGFSTPVKMFNFSGGEVHVKVPNSTFIPKTLLIKATITDSDGIMGLLLLNDALKRKYPGVLIKLLMPYLPYARQDRVCAEGEALSIKVMADLINGCNFHSVVIKDCHSDVGPALINNCINVGQEVIFKNYFETLDTNSTVFVAPDAGATKKIDKLSHKFGIGSVQALKNRCVQTGAILSTSAPLIFTTKPHAVIVDDICDGGRTFIELARALRTTNTHLQTITLVVTHGIFSKGTEPLLKAGINHIVTTNSINSFRDEEKITIV